MEYKIEHDSMGEVKVPADKYWGAQTERSHENFEIGVGIETMPREITKAFGYLKKAAAIANNALKPEKMTDEKLKAISQACDEVISGSLNDHFPLVVWQTGSGTQSNMNANEVIANRANEIAGKKICHPNDDINMSQSSNDTFPTALHISAVAVIEDKLFPAIDTLVATFKKLEKENEGIVKSGRTHLQDAVPISFDQEISGWRTSLERDKEMLSSSLPYLKQLALGGTAVGTGLNAPKGFDAKVAEAGALYYRLPKVYGEDGMEYAVKVMENMCFPHDVIDIVYEYNAKYRKPSSPESALVHMIDQVITRIELMDHGVGDSSWNQDMVIYQTLNEITQNGLYDESGMSINQYLKARDYLLREDLKK